jgi:atlastin
MWGEAIMVMNGDQEKVAVVLVDTQGTFDNSSTYRQCTTIFALRLAMVEKYERHQTRLFAL